MPYYKVVRVENEKRYSLVAITNYQNRRLIYEEGKTTWPHPEQGGLFCLNKIGLAIDIASVWAKFGEIYEIWEVEIGEKENVYKYPELSCFRVPEYIVVKSVKLLKLVKTFN